MSSRGLFAVSRVAFIAFGDNLEVLRPQAELAEIQRHVQRCEDVLDADDRGLGTSWLVSARPDTEDVGDLSELRFARGPPTPNPCAV